MDHFGYTEKPKEWFTCLKCGYIHVPILSRNLVRWVCVNTRSSRIYNKHHIEHNKPCLPSINDYADVNYKRLSSALAQYHTVLVPRVKGQSP